LMGENPPPFISEMLFERGLLQVIPTKDIIA
jgi:hypothetical protein